MKHWYMPTLIAFLFILAVSGADYALDHWPVVVWCLYGAGLFVIGCIVVGLIQSVRDARETDKLLGGGL